MLGFGSRSISGTPFGLNAVAATLAASGAFLTLGGSVSGTITLSLSASGTFLSLAGSGAPLTGVFREMQADGSLLTLSGLATPIWTQALTVTGAFLSLTGRPDLFIVGKPYKVSMISKPYVVRQDPQLYRAKMIAKPYLVRRSLG